MLKWFSGLFLVAVWLCVGYAIYSFTQEQVEEGHRLLPGGMLVLIALISSLPAVALFAFGQVVRDIRDTRDQLGEMLKLLRDGRY